MRENNFTITVIENRTTTITITSYDYYESLPLHYYENYD